MAIKRYGLDEAEIEHLKAANLTDEEINDLNKKRVQEQMDEESDEGDGWYNGEKDIYDHIRSFLPDTHPLVAKFLMTAPECIHYSDEDYKEVNRILDSVHGIPSTQRKKELNDAISIALKESFPNGIPEDYLTQIDFSIPSKTFMQERADEESGLRSQLAKEGNSQEEIEKRVKEEMMYLDAGLFIGGFIRRAINPAL